MLRKIIPGVLAVQIVSSSAAVCALAESAPADRGKAPAPAPAVSGPGLPASGAEKSAPVAPAAPAASAGASAPAGAPLKGKESAKISAVRISGNHRIEAAVIRQAIRVKAGETLDRELVDADVRAIFKLGYFRDVQAQIEKKDGGVLLEYLVQEKPVVREVKIEGASELKPDKVREAIEIKPNSIFTPKDLQKSVKKVKKLYNDEGYYLAEVTTFTSKRSETEINVTFKIKEGKKILIKSIGFEGNRAFTAKKLKKSMETSEEWMFSWLTGAGTYKEEELKNDQALLTDLYMNNGYLNVKVGEPKVELLPDKSGLKVSIGITEGEQYRIGKLGFRGELLDNRAELDKVLKEKSGEIFSRANLRNDVFALTDVYADKGYAFANISPLTELHPQDRSIDIFFELEKGDKVHIDRINITGNTKTRDKVVRRELRLEEGELYSSTGLKRSKQNLMNTGYFEEANIATAKGSAADKLDMNVEVKEKATGTFSVGAGYSSLDGVIGQGSVQQANFLGLGLKATAAVSFGSKSKTYNLGLTDPYFLDSKWSVGADVYRTERQYIDYTRRATGGDIKASYPLSDTLSVFSLYKFEEKEILDESQGLLESIHQGAVVAPEQHSTSSAILGSITSNTTDYHLDPSTGWINTASLEFAGLGGSDRYLRYTTEHTYFHPVGFGTVASIRGTLGYIQGLGKDIPIDERFYLGGIGTLRGFSPRTVSPNRDTTIKTGDPSRGNLSTSDSRVYLGGDSEAIVNVEYTFPLLKSAGLKGVLFFDAGNSDNGMGRTFGHVLASYGGGIRWFSPLGPLRLEWGVPITPRNGIDRSSGRLEFSIGSIF